MFLSLLKSLETLEPGMAEIQTLRSRGELELALTRSKELFEDQPGLPRLQALIKELEEALGLVTEKTGDSPSVEEKERQRRAVIVELLRPVPSPRR